MKLSAICVPAFIAVCLGGPAFGQSPTGTDQAAGPAITFPMKKHLHRKMAFANVPANPNSGAMGPVLTMNSFGFTAPSTGLAVVRARGFCNLNSDTTKTNSVVIEVHSATTTPFAQLGQEWGSIAVPPSATTVSYRLGWTAYFEMPVHTGDKPTIVVSAAHDLQFLSPTVCTGTVTLDVQ